MFKSSTLELKKISLAGQRVSGQRISQRVRTLFSSFLSHASAERLFHALETVEAEILYAFSTKGQKGRCRNLVIEHDAVENKGESDTLGSKGEEQKGRKEVTTKHRTKLVHEGNYVAEIDVELIEQNTGWSPYLSLDDAYKIDDVREALRRDDLQSATCLARVFELTPVAV